MNYELKAVTEPGARLVTLAEEHSADFATRADQHDRENTFVAENFDAMKESNFLGACAPEQFGGMGVESVHDLAVAISRIARGCASTAICANMHMVTVMIVSRQWREATKAGDAMRVAGTQMALTMLGTSKMVMSTVGTERGGLTVVPSTEGTPADGGYRINGFKAFGTNSEYADSIIVFLKVPDSDGSYQLAMATVPKGTKGMDVKNNWDALGMRGSGSHEIESKDCFVPALMVNVMAPLGPPPPILRAHVSRRSTTRHSPSGQ
jgi:alkylation response protein AidB-like acyl-CoA dehydrogenase